jgi:hypothetical protein
MSEIGERELRNFDIDTRNIIFRKKNSKKARSIISISKSVQLLALLESPLFQFEISAESQFLFLTGNISHSTENAPVIIFLQSIIRRSPFFA